LTVYAHEQRNIRRFEREAAVKGGEVIYKNIELYFGMQGSYIGAIGGKSEVKILYK
jgi:hypothetical protein